MYSIARSRTKLSTLLIPTRLASCNASGGSANKWKLKRLQEREALNKERQQLPDPAKIRAQLRANLSGKSPSPDLGHSAVDHVRALADRFVKEGAEDLWNADDGPLRCRQKPKQKTGASSENGGKGSGLKQNDAPKMISSDSNLSKSSSRGGYRKQNVVRNNNFRVRQYCTSASGGNSGLNSLVFSRHYSANVWRKGKLWRNPKVGDDDDDSDWCEKDVRTSRRRLPRDEEEGEDLGRVEFSVLVERLRNDLEKKKLKEGLEIDDREPLLSEKRFDECGISPLTVKALLEAGYAQMTRVQEAAIAVGLEGKDAFIKAKPGIGKNAAFLVPAIETVVNVLSTKNKDSVPPIEILILCPTRELACQIEAESKVILKYHNAIGVQTLTGGTRFKEDEIRLKSEPCQILVATPGRLLDHIESKSGFAARLKGLKMLVIDEVDHLLDLGFRKEMDTIVNCLPHCRQSFVFSAIMPKEVHQVSQLVLKREHAYVDIVGLGCMETASEVKQLCLVAPHQQHFEILLRLLTIHLSQVADYKVFVFCATAAMSSLMYLLLCEMKMNVRELHAGMPQIRQTRFSNEFRERKRLILITSDVRSRGIDYPDVTLVMQVGVPPNREQCIHRLGRTACEDNNVRGILLIAPWEEHVLDELKDLPLEKCQLPNLDPDVNKKVEESMAKIDPHVKESAYHGWLRYYNSVARIGRDKTTHIELADKFRRSIGLHNVPDLSSKTATGTGLSDTPGISVTA